MDGRGWVRRARQALLLLTGLAATAASQARPHEPAALLHDPATCARPALWVVSDADTIIYLFGTIHTHDGRAHWFDHAVRRAFNASSTLVLETVVPERLTQPVFRPTGGLAAAQATITTARSLGMQVTLGADQVLHRAAEAAGKPVIGLERFEDQLAIYRALPSPSRPAAAGTATPDPAVTTFLQAMMDGWNQGDASRIEAVVGAVQAQSPEAYRRLFADRNTAWAQWIARRLDQPGTVFVAVGTGHLVGTDSVQRKLAAAGVPSARIN